MIDTTTYGLTKDLPSGPIYRPAEPIPHEIYLDKDDAAPLTQGRLIGGVVSFCLLAATGIYIFLTF